VFMITVVIRPRRHGRSPNLLGLRTDLGGGYAVSSVGMGPSGTTVSTRITTLLKWVESDDKVVNLSGQSEGELSISKNGVAFTDVCTKGYAATNF